MGSGEWEVGNVEWGEGNGWGVGSGEWGAGSGERVRAGRGAAAWIFLSSLSALFVSGFVPAPARCSDYTSAFALPFEQWPAEGRGKGSRHGRHSPGTAN